MVIDFRGDAVLFDLDGTLVDSTASVERAWAGVADRLGTPFARFEPFMHGIPARQVLDMVAPGLPEAEVSDVVERMLVEQAEDTGDVHPLPGALAMLDGLPTRRWAIVTSGDRRLAVSRIRAAGLPAPRVLITADDVSVGKPDPACYLAGAAALGFVPERCLVVEDAPAGVVAGRAAGMQVLGLLTTYDDLDGATATARDLAAVEVAADRLGIEVRSA